MKSGVSQPKRKTYFVSDTHFDHGNIIKYCHRPFLSETDREFFENNGNVWHHGSWKGQDASRYRISLESIELMNDHLIDNINKMVGPDDELWHLGDFCMFNDRDKGYYNRCKRFRDRIKCNYVNIVWGNHDDECIRDLFEEARDLAQISIDGQYFVLSHYAYAVWNKSHRGAINLYGHSHSQAEPWMDRCMPGRRSIDVGVDNAKKVLGEFRPFSVKEINSIMVNRKGFSMDHHIPRNADTPEESTVSD